MHKYQWPYFIEEDTYLKNKLSQWPNKLEN